MAIRRTVRNVPRLELRAAFEPSSLNAEKRTVDIVWTTGARVLRGFWERYWEELSLDPDHVRMERLENGAPLLAAHNGYDLAGVIGVVESAKIQKSPKRGVATVRFATAEASPEAELAFRKVQEGVLRNVSVGYQIHRLEKIEEKKGEAPVYRATDWEPMELSLVPIGADAGAKVRAEDALTNPCEFVDEVADEETRTMDDDKITTPGTPTPATPAAAAPAPAPEAARAERAKPAPTAEEAARAAVLADRKRAADLRGAARACAWAIGEDVANALAEEHVTAGTDLVTFRGVLLAKVGEARERGPQGASRLHIVPGEADRDKWLRGAEAQLLVRAGVGGLAQAAAQKRGETLKLDPGEFRGMGFLELAKDALRRAGQSVRGKMPEEIFALALTMRDGPYQGTGDFPVLLENTMHKTLLSAYETVESTWRRWCGVVSATDFRAHNFYRRSAFGQLATVNENGEFTTLAVPDGEKEAITLATKGKIIALTRQSLINDDMGVFNQIAVGAGQSAALSIEADAYAALALNAGMGPTMNDAVAMFNSVSHANVGGGAALSVAALDADRVVMAQQTDPSGNQRIVMRPVVLLVPLSLGGLARVINEAEFDTDSGVNENRPNMVRGMFRDIVDTAYLTGTRRYEFADPATSPAIAVAFLNGNQAPTLRMREGWRVDGTEWKVVLDYKVGGIDYRAALTDAGV